MSHMLIKTVAYLYICNLSAIMKVLNLLITLDHGWGTYLLSRAVK